jgi:hypothetical protein
MNYRVLFYEGHARLDSFLSPIFSSEKDAIEWAESTLTAAYPEPFEIVQIILTAKPKKPSKPEFEIQRYDNE